MRRWAWGILTAALSVAPGAHAADPLDVGSGFHLRCVSRGEVVSQMTTCLTYVLGMHEGIRAMLQNSRARIYFEGEPQETMAIFVEYLKRNPPKPGDRTADLYIAAMIQAFPCARPPSDKRS